jgi:hypothetical protein
MTLMPSTRTYNLLFPPVLPHLHVSLFPTLDHSLQRRSHWPLLKCRTPTWFPSRCLRGDNLDAAPLYAAFSKVSSLRWHQDTSKCHTHQQATRGPQVPTDLSFHLLSRLPPAGSAPRPRRGHCTANKPPLAASFNREEPRAKKNAREETTRSLLSTCQSRSKNKEQKT